MRVLLTAVWGIAGAMIGNFLLMAMEFWWLHPGNPDAGQLGVLGIWIGLPIGCLVAWKILGKRHRPGH